MADKKPEEVFKYTGNTTKPGNPLWDEYVDTRTGKSTLEIHTLKPASNFDRCDHYFEPIDDHGGCQCKYCGLGKSIVWGLEICGGGKIVRLDSPDPSVS